MIGKFQINQVLFLIVFVILGWFNTLQLHGDEPENLKRSHDIKLIYEDLQVNNHFTLPSVDVFSIALRGYENLKTSDTTKINKNILTIIDFSKSSNKKRLWVIDMDARKVLFHDLVAHGVNSGNEYARSFSNVPQTNMSSLGFFITGETYHGKHGLSLFLNGMDKGFNHNARKRYIVMHGANYVSYDFIKKYGRLGRSFGCPSVSMDIYKDVITTIADGSCLFIYYPDNEFLAKSEVLNN